MENVYYSKELKNSFLKQLKKDLKETFEGCQKIAIKIHFGEPGNKTAFTPDQIKPIIEILNELKIDFFFYDSSVAYGGPRGNPLSHKKMAIEKGWGKLGDIKTDDEFIIVEGKNLPYEVCKSLASADGVLVVSHVKGHVCTGFGGAIKNLGMGALTKESKMKIHAGGEPKLVGECKICKSCERLCPIGGISVSDRPNIKNCYGCSNCCVVCPEGVLVPKLNYFDILLADGASSAQSVFKKKYYISYMVNITKECDCEENPKQIICNDTGYLMAKDGVAIDKVSYDLILSSAGENVFEKFNFKDGIAHIKAAQDLGMGLMDYNLIKLD